ncbi:ATP-binding cassette sub-family C member 4-like isoform X2 [Anthonomus grandis grandis]|uniref:ATP-binding cassette sub-family C member 4-like isoform X2 n=1 Tax=Anthonomus grandis grandis TaxID=2921223 RepID=UPI002165758D|nr:ATP-binding cassette sub-family C member 4-like isoform X2 [Anthonomus grandis grandis]
MEAAFSIKQENPKKKANIISRLFFGWIAKLFYTGAKRSLKLNDIYKTLECDESKLLGDKLEKKWLEEVSRGKEKHQSASLLRVISKVFLKEYCYYGLMLFILTVVLRSPQPLVLSWLINQFQPHESHEKIEMYASASSLVIISTLIIFFLHHNSYGQSCVGMRVRIAVSSLIYRKILKLNKRSQGETAAGQVVNLLSNDVQRFDLVCVYLHYLWIMPFQVALVTYFLWNAVGISCLAGILSMVLCTLPLQGYLGKVASSLRLKVAQRTDARVKLMSEIISGAQVIKMYAWEKPFEKLIKYLRLKEINVLTKTSYLRGFYLSCMVFIERSTLCLTLVCFTLLGNNIKADIVFSMAQFFNILQSAMAIMYPMAISIGAETLVSIRRLEEFLNLEEKEKTLIEQLYEPEIILKQVTASWVQDTKVLKKVNLHIPKGCLCAIIGPVGSGKSSILQLLLGELSPTFGSVMLGGSVSYSSQEPWLFVASVRRNILFGKPYDHRLYKEVTKVCALERDFEQLPYGDKTMVGERGVSLSGGQRARINLARAIYQQADVYLLDDPLSAVDTHVGKHLFDQCVVDYLRNKTRVLVTHQLQYLKKADLIVVLNEGVVEATGTFKELSHSKLDFTKLLASADETVDEKETCNKLSPEKQPRKLSLQACSATDSVEIEQSTNKEKEEMGGKEGETPFLDYIKSVGSACFIAIVVLVLIFSQASCTCTDLWVTYWTSQEELRHFNDNQTIIYDNNPSDILMLNPSSNDTYSLLNNSNVSNSLTYSHEKGTSNVLNTILGNMPNVFDKLETGTTYYTLIKTNIAMYIYGALILLAIILTTARSLLFFKAAMEASKNIHSKMFHRILEAPMRFFDTNSSGRVLNRFSKDIGAIDEILPRVLMEATQILLVLVGILVNVTVSNYYMVIAMVVLGCIFMKLRQWYTSSAKDIKHLEGIAKSPVFSHITSSLNGLTTIRASKAEDALIQEFDEHQDVHTSAWFLTIMCTVFFGLWLDIICVIFITCVAFGFVISAELGQPQNSSLVGLALSQSLILTGMLQYGMRQTAEVVNQLTSVERVLQYTKLEKEGPFHTPKGKLPVLPWPSLGKIEFRNLKLFYALEEAPVLKNLNMLIRSGEKVGIVGRTGAGKSSLIAALFRLAPIEGQILIDDLDTKTIGLSDLRRRISIIPQEPVLFSATLRYNLDPFDEFEDARLWEVLEEVQTNQRIQRNFTNKYHFFQVELKDLVTTLDFQVLEGGSNLSLGQRQLLCLARALLRNNKILVLDEATANVDARTDSLIQTTIRRKFKKCTVLTIAHRLNTIMDSDKVIVMGAGQILEHDHPYSLLENPDGHFTSMVQETGPTMTEQLKEVAFAAWKMKKEIEDSYDRHFDEEVSKL